MANEIKLKTGDVAPKFTLKDTYENDVSLGDFRGKWVVLYFYPKDNTSGCTTEALDFTARIKEFEKLNAVILGVSPDSCKSHQNFTSKHGLKVTLLSDPERKVLQAYGAWGKKKQYGREYMGVIRSTVLIDPDGKVVEIWPKVKVKDHAEAVKNRLQELQAG
ncbi:MAG: thioredoxin-dependent thiol peroxidase [Calditrichia bacterium]